MSDKPWWEYVPPDAALDSFATMWLQAKHEEKLATDARRSIEDRMATLMLIPTEGTVTQGRVKVTARLTRKVDGDKLQEIAREHGLEAHLSNLFRWKPEINAKVWQATAEEITRPLLGAITTTPGRPTFVVSEPPSERTEQEKTEIIRNIIDSEENK